MATKQPMAKERTKAKRSSAAKSKSSTIYHRPSAFEAEWDEFVESAKRKLHKSIGDGRKDQIPHYHPISLLKRLIYEFVRENRGKVLDSEIERAIYNAEYINATTDVGKPVNILYNDRPFYRVLYGLRRDIKKIGLELPKADFTRIPQHLEYADRHNVPTQDLIGFLYQAGPLNEICKKARDPGRRETWYKSPSTERGKPI